MDERERFFQSLACVSTGTRGVGKTLARILAKSL